MLSKVCFRSQDGGITIICQDFFQKLRFNVRHFLVVFLALYMGCLAMCIDISDVHRGEVYPVETDERLCDVLQTGRPATSDCLCSLWTLLVFISTYAGQEVEVDLEKDVLTDIASGKQYPLKSIGEVSLQCRWSLLDA